MRKILLPDTIRLSDKKNYLYRLRNPLSTKPTTLNHLDRPADTLITKKTRTEGHGGKMTSYDK